MGRTPDKSPRHGTAYQYKRYGCRCVKCRLAMSDYMKRYRGRGRKEKSTTLTHGLRSSYNNGCRCPRCTEANREYSSQHWRDHYSRDVVG